eukprot:gene25934-biopygen11908
MSRGVFATG